MQLSESEKVGHLLRRFAFGASQKEIDYYGANGLAGAIDKLLNFESIPDEFVSVELLSPRGNPRPQSVQLWWLVRMATTRRPLQEKIALYWHNHFATSAQKVDGAYMMHTQNEIFRSKGVGRFETLLLEVSKDPAMLYWLDNQENVKGKPNENFAREVMELFTLGIGHYSERDVQEAAKAFTGWTFGRGLRKEIPKTGKNVKFQFKPELHEEGLKTVLGQKGKFFGEDVISVLCAHPQTARFVAKKMWEWFAYPNPDDGLVDRLAQKFRAAHLEIKVLLRAIMEAPEFYSEACYRKQVKNPVDYTVSTLRQLGVGATTQTFLESADMDEASVAKARAISPYQAAGQSTKAMGMDVLYPPDVSGWKPHAEFWISSATMVERIKWASRLFDPAYKGGPGIRFPAATLFDAGIGPGELVREILSLFDVVMSPAKIKQLEGAAESEMGSRLTPQNANKATLAVCRVLFGSPEFQFC